jgi:hypothetical protein
MAPKKVAPSPVETQVVKKSNPYIHWLLWLIVGWAPLTAAANDYLVELTAAAHAKGLAERLEWRTLLHYKPRLIRSGFESQADDPAFFNAPDGKTNPRTELDATLAAFFSTAADTDREPHPQCRFIARYRWLKQELRFDVTRLPEQPCQRFREWRAALNPKAITLVFPSSYLNNPASLFGHTLLRVDAYGQDERTRLLAHTINYAAATADPPGFLYAAKGLFGGYPGVFSTARYYRKVTEYNDLENRDIWEYELAFTPEEIDRLLMHVWELNSVRFDYYFVDENCSYHLLSLFDAARPSLRLTDRFPVWTIPADTVRALTQEPGLLRAVTYRPAQSTILRHRQRQLPPEQIRLAKAIALAPAEDGLQVVQTLATEEQARVIEVASEYLDYQRRRERVPLADEVEARVQQLLLARSRLTAADAESPPVPAVRPDQGHGSARVAIALGREHGLAYQELRLRPAYHDLLDPEDGYNRGAEIEFFDVVLRRQDGRTRIQSVDLLNIVSLAARDELLKPLSWKINLGYARKRLTSGHQPLVAHAKGGVGFAAEDTSGSLWYGLLESELNIDGHLDHDYSIGIGPGIGVLFDFTPRWRAHVEGRALRYGVGDTHSASEVAVNQRFTLGGYGALQLQAGQRREFGQRSRNVALSWSVYF